MMVENILTLVDSYVVVGDFELDRALKTLLGSLAYVSARSTNRARWKEVLDAFVIPYAVNQVPGLGAAPLSGLVAIMPSSA